MRLALNLVLLTVAAILFISAFGPAADPTGYREASHIVSLSQLSLVGAGFVLVASAMDRTLKPSRVRAKNSRHDSTNQGAR